MTSIPSQPADHGISTSPTCPKSPPGNFTIYDMNPVDLADHFIETIYNWRVETSIKQDLEHVPLNVGVLSTLDELVIYSPQNDCLYRYPVDAVPIEVVRQIEGLARAQDFGVGCFNQLYEVLERTVRNNSISENPEEDFGKGAKGAVAMLAELSLQIRSRLGSDYTMLENANYINLHVVIVDRVGESHRYPLFIRPDADVQSFHKEMDQKFPQYCDPYDEWAYKNWDERIQDLRKTGLGRHPDLHRIVALVTMHQAMVDIELPEWMYYTILEGGGSEIIEIQDEESFRTMMDRAAKKESPACLMRVREAKFRNIFVELRSLEEKQLALAQTQKRSEIQDSGNDRHESQQPSEGTPKNNTAGNEYPFFDSEPLGFYDRLTYLYNLDHDNSE